MHGLAPEIEDWIEEAAVVGIVEVLKKYGYFKKRFDATLAAILKQNPAAVVLIDYPGFNLRLAKALRQRQFTGKILYYISPQVWAWHRSRIPKMAQWLDLMLCIFPFEKVLYEGYGLKTEFAGHPLVDWHRAQDRGLVRQENLIGLFPGSRRREIIKHVPVLLETARKLAEMHPETRFVLSAASEKLRSIIEPLTAASPGLPLEIQQGNAYDLMRTCTVGAVASGTATLEAAILGLPHVLIYKVAWPTYVAGKMLVKVPHLGIVNVLAGREIVPELIQAACEPGKLTTALSHLLNSPDARAEQLRQTAAVVEALGTGDAYGRAASLVAKSLAGY
jgi:lipid-A-disaccharide synthase